MAPELLDARGRPIRRDVLPREISAPTTAGVRSVLRAHSTSGVTPARLAAMLRQAETPGAGGAEAYLELAEHMEEVDLHYFGVLQTRKRQVAQIGVAVEPASDSAEHRRDADLAAEYLGSRRVVDELFDVLDALGKGFSISEIVWETSERQWMPARIEWRQPRWFEWDPTGRRPLLRTAGAPEELAPWKFVTHQAKAKSGLAVRGGLARIAAWGWLFKSLALKDWARFVEAYGAPLRIGKYGPNATQDDIDILTRAVANVAADAAALVPEGMNIEFVAADTRGRSEVFKDLITYIDEKLSIAILGQTLTTQSAGAGSYALGQVHDLVRHDIEQSDAAQLAETLERDLVTPIVALNRGPRDAYPSVRIERPKARDAEREARVLSMLVPLGLRVRETEARERLGYEAPAAGDAVLAAPATAAARHARLAAMNAAGAGNAGNPAAAPTADPIEQVLEAIDADAWERLASPVIRPVLDRARADPDGLLADIAAVYPQMDSDALAERLARILFVADLWGGLTALD